MLRASTIGPTDHPNYRINTYSAGQKKTPASRFSDGTPIFGEQAYIILTLDDDPKIEIRVLGSAAELTSVTPDAIHSFDNARFDSWLLNTPDSDHHGDMFNGDGGASSCATCHWDYWMKKPAYRDLRPSAGWCFRCQDGIEGTESGFRRPEPVVEESRGCRPCAHSARRAPPGATSAPTTSVERSARTLSKGSSFSRSALSTLHEDLRPPQHFARVVCVVGADRNRKSPSPLG